MNFYILFPILNCLIANWLYKMNRHSLLQVLIYPRRYYNFLQFVLVKFFPFKEIFLFGNNIGSNEVALSPSKKVQRDSIYLSPSFPQW